MCSFIDLLSRRWRLPLAACLLFLGPASSALAKDDLSKELAIVAQKIKLVLEDRNETAIAVGAFTGPSHLPSSAGPSIAHCLATELGKVGISVKKQAALEVKGDYLDVNDKKSKQLAAMLKGRVMDRSGTTIVDFERGVFDPEAIASLFGLTTDLPPSVDIRNYSEPLRQALDAPKTYINNSRVSAGPHSPYGIAVEVRSGGGKFMPRDAKSRDGLAFVPIQKNEIYAIRLFNDSASEAAVHLTIDGLSMFSFSEIKKPGSSEPKFSRVVIAPKSSVLVLGWHRTNEASDSFLVTEYAKTAAAELHSSAPLGTITATFAAAWPKDGVPPADEPTTRSAEGTGRGPTVGQKYTEVERYFGVIRGTASIRYTK